MSFIGEYIHALDDKGRLTIPARFRSALEKDAVITRGFDKNLVIYTPQVFDEISKRLMGLSLTVFDNRALNRMIHSRAYPVEMDRAGRTVIHPNLRDYAGLNGEVVIVGVGLAVEVWSKDEWAMQLQALDDPAVNARRYEALDIGQLTGE